MFSYYGAKTNLVKFYPFPKHARIIEPFAGSAKYALWYYSREVWINDVDPVIFSIWNWLIHEATIKDVLKLPKLSVGDDLRNFQSLAVPERNLLGFCVNKGSATPCNIVTARADQANSRHRLGKGDLSLMEMTRKRILYYLPRIKHWRVTNSSYSCIKINPEATWFVDPPYQGKAGKFYRFNQVDYGQLALWCQSRIGQVIVCEGAEGKWLPFYNLGRVNQGSYRNSNEKMWLK